MSALTSEAAREAVQSAWNTIQCEAIPMPKDVAKRAGKYITNILSDPKVRGAMENFDYRIGNGIGIEHIAIIMFKDQDGKHYLEVRNPNRYHDKASDRIVPDIPILRIREDGIFVVEQSGQEKKIDSPEIPLPDYLQF